MNSAANHPKRFLILWGPPSVGKMTIGQALSEQTGLKLFHNHMTIEPLLPIFEFHDPVFLDVEPCGLEVEEDERSVEFEG